jgi:hypothetical protein
MKYKYLIAIGFALLTLPIAFAQTESPKCDPTSFWYGFCKWWNEDLPLGWNKFVYGITKNPSFAENIVRLREQIQQERMKEMAYIQLLHQQGQLTKEDYAKKMIELQTNINEQWMTERKEIIENNIPAIQPEKPVCMIPEGCGDNFIKFQECVKLGENCKIKNNSTACDLFNQNCMDVTTMPSPPIVIPLPTPSTTIPGVITPTTLPQQIAGSCVRDEDCERQGLVHPMIVGQWKCVDGKCVWQSGQTQIPGIPSYQLPFGKYVWQIYGS